MKLKYPVIAVFLLAYLPAEAASFPAQKPKGLKKGANVSLNLTNKKKSPPQTYLNMGLLSNFSSLNGVGINAISSIVHQDVKGVQLSGFLNISGMDAYGLQLAGIANLTGKNAEGVSLAGLMNLNGTDAKGFQVAGLGNVASNNLSGISLAGLLNISGKNTTGMQLAGLANVTGNHHRGIAVGGLMNAAARNSSGVQLTSLLNIAGEENRGIQIAGLGNVSVTNKGLQLGFSNYSAQNRGVQIGFGNIVNKGDKGLQFGFLNVSGENQVRQIGCINIKPETRTQLIVSGGNSSKLNLAVRFKNRYTYTQFGVGTYQLGFGKDFSLSGFYRAGLSCPLTSRLDLSADLGYYHIESFENKHQGLPARLYALQPRINLEYAITHHVGFSVSGGYEWQFRYKGQGKFNDKPVFEVGVILF